jgi:hypothetical protein
VYQLQYKNNLTNSTWLLLSNFSGNDTLDSMIVSTPSSSRFYRATY